MTPRSPHARPHPLAGCSLTYVAHDAHARGQHVRGDLLFARQPASQFMSAGCRGRPLRVQWTLTLHTEDKDSLRVPEYAGRHALSCSLLPFKLPST